MAPNASCEKMSGLQLSESTIERTTEAAGERVAETLGGRPIVGTESSRGLGRKTPADKRCAYVSLDATGVRQQGPGGTRVDGKMAYVAMVYNARSEHDSTRPPPRQVRYLSGFYDFQTLGRQLHREALEVGWTAGGAADCHLRRWRWAGGFLPHLLPQGRMHLGFLARQGILG